MNKLLISTMALVALATTVSADTKHFIGLEAASSNIEGTVGQAGGTVTYQGVTYTNVALSGDERDGTFGLKVGAVINEQHRIYLNYAKYSPDVYGVNIDVTTSTLNYDHMFQPSSAGITPFVGAHFGVVKAQALGFSDTGSIVGVQAGALYSMTDNIEFDLGLSYSLLNVEPTTSAISGTYGDFTLAGAKASLDIEEIVKTYVGVNYKF